MTAIDLRSFGTRSLALIDSDPPATIGETRAWLVDPFLETLGWDIHADSCLTDTVVDGTTFEYVCTVDPIPALFVAVESYSDSLNRSRASAIGQTMARTGIDRALYTNGQQLLFLAGTTEITSFHCELDAIADHESSINHYTNAGLSQHLKRHSRHHVARQLALERTTVAESIVSELTAVSGPTYETEFESATDRFLDRLIDSFTTDTEALPVTDVDADPSVSIQFTEPATGAGEPTDSDPPESTSTAESTSGGDNDRSDGSDRPGNPAADEHDTSPDEDADDRTDESDDTAGDQSEDDEASDQSGDEDGEYVVRFFNDRTSIGAIGYSTSEQALVHAAEYCFERGLSGVEVPWGPDDEAVLNDNPVYADGSPMDDSEQLSNGLYLNVSGGTTDHATRIEALAARSGLRAMLTGDWESSV